MFLKFMSQPKFIGKEKSLNENEGLEKKDKIHKSFDCTNNFFEINLRTKPIIINTS